MEDWLDEKHRNDFNGRIDEFRRPSNSRIGRRIYHLYRNRLHADAICGLHVPTTRQLPGRRTANILHRRWRRSSELDIRRDSLYRKYKSDKQTDSNLEESLKNAIPHNRKARQRQNAAHDVNALKA